MAMLDKYTPRLLGLFQSKGGALGERLKANLSRLFQVIHLLMLKLINSLSIQHALQSYTHSTKTNEFISVCDIPTKYIDSFTSLSLANMDKEQCCFCF